LPDILRRYKVATIIRFGTPESPPYGANIPFDSSVSVTIVTPGVFDISYDTTLLTFSSSTQPGTYLSDGSSSRQK